jgi:hypothetical protein
VWLKDTLCHAVSVSQMLLPMMRAPAGVTSRTRTWLDNPGRLVRTQAEIVYVVPALVAATVLVVSLRTACVPARVLRTSALVPFLAALVTVKVV